jgi:hypothetical protein
MPTTSGCPPAGSPPAGSAPGRPSPSALAPADSNAYKRVILPPLKVADGLFEIDVKSVFAADVDGDGSPDLCILSSYYRDGSGEKAYPATDCFAWTGSGFHLLDTAPMSVGLKNAKAVRAHFAKQPIAQTK